MILSNMYAANSNRPEVYKRNTSRAKVWISEPTVVLGAVNLISMRDWQYGERDAIKMQCSSNAILTADLASDSGRTDIPS